MIVERKNIQEQEDRRRKQEEKNAYVEECRKNYEELSLEVSHFLSGSFGCENFSREDNKEFWEKASEIKEALKEAKLFKEHRDELWCKRQEACERVIRHQQSANELRISRSDDCCNKIIDRAGLARPEDLFGFMPEDVDSMKRCGRLIKEAWELLSEHKHEMTREDKDKCFQYITETQEMVNDWWDNYKEYKKERRRSWEESVRERLEKNYERLSKAEAARDRVSEHIRELEQSIEDSWSDGYRDRASEWLSEEEDKLRDIEAHIERIESWIEEDEAKLR